MAILGAALVAVAAFFLGKGTAITGTPGPVPSAPASTATASTPLPPASTPITPSATALPPIPTASTPSAAPSAVVEKATLLLLGDGTVVSVDGVSRGSAPAKAAVEPGTHVVSFAFPATGESKGMTLTLKAADRVTLRADFTGATPTIRVQR
jgi:hypothetical protein